MNCVPTCIIYAKEKEVSRVEGIDIPTLIKQIKDAIIKNFPLYLASLPGAEVNHQQLTDKLKQLINQSKVMVFMKGEKSNPKCGFSRQLVQILNEINVEYQTFDVFQDEEVRQGLKLYSNWPTYPQVYVNGNLIGGLDIIKVSFFNKKKNLNLQSKNIIAYV